MLHRHHDVLGFKVAEHRPVFMTVLYDISQYSYGVAYRRLVFVWKVVQPVQQIPTSELLHDQVEAIGIFVCLDDVNQVGVVQLPTTSDTFCRCSYYS